MTLLTDLRRPGIVQDVSLAALRFWQKLALDNIDRLNSSAGDAVDTLTAAIAGAGVPSTRQIIAGTGLAGGGTLAADVTLSASFGSGASNVCQGNDSRLSDARAPTGTAGGDLSGTYPNPTIAALDSGRVTLVSATTSTTDNAFHTILSIPVPTNKTLSIAVRIVGRRTNGTEESLNGRMFTGAKNIAGDVTWNAANDIIADEKVFTGDDGNYSIASGRSNPNAIFKVRGNTGHNMDWVAYAEYFQV